GPRVRFRGQDPQGRSPVFSSACVGRLLTAARLAQQSASGGLYATDLNILFSCLLEDTIDRYVPSVGFRPGLRWSVFFGLGFEPALGPGLAETVMEAPRQIGN